MTAKPVAEAAPVPPGRHLRERLFVAQPHENGTGNLLVYGGQVNLSNNNNNHTGATEVRDGELVLAAPNAVSGAVVLDGGWLVLFGHDVGPQGARQVTRTDALDELCRYATDPATGIWTDTVEAVGRYVEERMGG